MNQKLQTILAEAQVPLNIEGVFSFDIDYLNSQLAKDKKVWVSTAKTVLQQLNDPQMMKGLYNHVYLIFTLVMKNYIDTSIIDPQNIMDDFDMTPPTMFLTRQPMNFLQDSNQNSYIHKLESNLTGNPEYVCFYNTFPSVDENEKLNERLVVCFKTSTKNT